jgi:hypothetical protein
LTASVTPSGATATYQWQESATSGGTYANISGATSSAYTPVAGDATKYIKVVATGTGSYSGTVTSAATGAVAAKTVATTTIKVIPAALNAATAGQSYTQTTAFSTSAKGTYTYSYNSSSGTGLPEGMSFNPATNKVTGTPTEAGNFTFEIDATNKSTGVVASSNQTLAVKAPTITIKGSLTTATEDAVFNAPQTAQFTATETGNSSPGITFSKVGELPPGISLSMAGAVYGAATEAGNFTFFVIATDSLGFSANKSFTLAVKAPTVKIVATLPAGQEGSAYSGSISANETGGTVTCGVGFVPSSCGLSYSKGSISGGPTMAGTIQVTVVAVDGNGYSITNYFTITVKAPTIKIAATLPAAIAGAAYTPKSGTNGFTAKDAGNKSAVFEYTITGLPTGLVSNENTGAVTGAPSVAGRFTIQVVAAEVLNGGQIVAQGYGTSSLTVNAPTISFKTATVTAATAGGSYSGATFTAQESTNSSATFTYTESGLPSWLTGTPSNGTLTLSGSVPAKAVGKYSFLITAKDGNNFSCTKSFTLTVKA